MNAKLYALLFLVAVLACDSPTEETFYEDDNPKTSDEEIILHKETSYWLGYEGVIPCADCQGIRMELKLENNPDKTEQAYELTETYLETQDGDRVFHQSGQIEISYGIDREPNVFVINLLDENLRPNYRFIQDSEGKLHLLDQNGQRIQSDLNYTLEKK